MSRTVILGGPRTGKTTLAASMRSGRLVHTDDLISTHAWSDASDAIAKMLDAPGPWVIEGVAAVRGLRKWLRAHAAGKPCDTVVAMWQPRVPLSKGQLAMAKACRTVFDEIRGELTRRGVAIR